MNEIDFKDLDSMIRWNNKKFIMEKVNALGCEYVSECVFDLYYYEHQSMKTIARMLDVVLQTVSNWMTRWGMRRRKSNGKY